MLRVLISICLLLLTAQVFSQPSSEPIKLRNSSFEGYPQPSVQPDHWVDCGFLPDESAPDTQPFGSSRSTWGQRIQAQEGFSYMGMVVRDNDTWERVSQKLPQNLEAGKCYEVSVFLSSSPRYMSQSRVTQKYVNYNKPCVLRIRSAKFNCQVGEILAESPAIQHNFWKRYVFQLRPTSDVEYLVLEAFYKTPTLFSYNGNILIDNLSQIVEIPCNEDIPLARADANEPEQDDAPVAMNTQENVTTSSSAERGSSSFSKDEARVNDQKEPANKILEELERDKLQVGKTIQIETLTFAADSFDIREESYPVLNEISQFLRDNNDVTVEIGGHTSRKPGINRQFCIDLSMNRAKAVRDYLVANGVDPTQLSYKGYGYNKPVANNVTKEGRRKNQRVEIKVIKIEI